VTDFGALAAIITALLGGGGIGGILAWWRRGSALKARAVEAETALEQSRRSSNNELIDQLQEELREHRTAANARATAQDERLNRLDRHHDLAREHIHELRSHIWEGKPPPPPPWPAGLPR
jgi:hypothetical protein